MKKKEANDLLRKASYLLDKTITLKNPKSIPPFQEDQYLVESFGAAKVHFGNSNSITWYEVWANLKNIETGKKHKMFLHQLINIFPKKKVSNSKGSKRS